ncbi:MAG TPA: hypothetical protein P5330_05975, partial [Candidatus Competibacteraceae bacterium]|nr:hypothetical protein [Candidatus Competibacteraceae bacterium]
MRVERCRITAAGAVDAFGVNARIFIQIAPPTVFQSIPKALSWGMARISQRLDHCFNIDSRIIVVNTNQKMFGIKPDMMYTGL